MDHIKANKISKIEISEARSYDIKMIIMILPPTATKEHIHQPDWLATAVNRKRCYLLNRSNLSQSNEVGDPVLGAEVWLLGAEVGDPVLGAEVSLLGAEVGDPVLGAEVWLRSSVPKTLICQVASPKTLICEVVSPTTLICKLVSPETLVGASCSDVGDSVGAGCPDWRLFRRCLR